MFPLHIASFGRTLTTTNAIHLGRFARYAVAATLADNDHPVKVSFIHVGTVVASKGDVVEVAFLLRISRSATKKQLLAFFAFKGCWPLHNELER